MRDDIGPVVDGDGLIEVFAWQTEPGYAVHLLNYTNPNALAYTVRKHYPLGPQTVRMTLPADTRIRRARLLRADTDLVFRQDGRQLSFTVPGLMEYEVAAFEI
jgi:hypothetical protein